MYQVSGNQSTVAIGKILNLFIQTKTSCTEESEPRYCGDTIVIAVQVIP